MTKKFAKKLDESIKLVEPTILHRDNVSMMHFSKCYKFNERIKHIKIKYHFMGIRRKK